MKNIGLIYDAMNKEIIEIINLLSETEPKKVFSFGPTYDTESSLLFESFPENRFKIYDKTGRLIAEGLFDKNGMVEGRAKIISEEGYLEFEGCFVDSKRCGYGIEYIYNGNKNKEGQWENDTLINGVIYDVILNYDGELTSESIEQLDNPFSLIDLEKYADELKIGNLSVINGQKKVIKNSIRNATDFLIEKASSEASLPRKGTGYAPKFVESIPRP